MAQRRSRERRRRSHDYVVEPKSEEPHRSSRQHGLHLPRYNHNGHEVTRGIQPEGESGRKGIHPFKFLKICFKSSCTLSMIVNVLWPIVPVAIALHFARPKWHLAIFITNYIAMIPAANLVGFAGQEFARKLPKAVGALVETTFGSIVEIVLFMVLLKTSKGDANVPVIRAAILGSILANMLLCLGACFFAGGMRREDQEFHPAIAEAGSGLMLVAGMGLILPAVYAKALTGRTDLNLTADEIPTEVRRISRAVAIILLVGYFAYVWYQTKTHDSLFTDAFNIDDERDVDGHKDARKPKLTLTESILAILIALTCVSMIAVFLVEQIPYMVEDYHISDAFLGLILVPLVEKAAEHLTAVDEAWDNQMNFALAHVLGASIQTALLNTPLVVLVGWGINVHMDLNFEIFDAVALILAILVVGSFLRDGKSNYLEGVLCIMVYVIIATTAWFYPNPPHHGGH
ncbi:Sodium/calcium exchanger protein-domain-containing protein [Dendryphion nanum]|uniref:Vacuolar calcium ion transporter n=1 Tax=Dendryphion nanum TaxID=256645 RepID=A0A9P9DLV4_9PLEO|nr:Sodium/calcium exchanger protein-domain-containing protein [Dendryphion nanum]